MQKVSLLMICFFTASFVLNAQHTIEESRDHLLKSNHIRRWHLEALYSFNYSPKDKQVFSAMNIYRDGYQNKFGFPTLTLSYSINERLGINLTYLYTQKIAAALQYAGTVYDPGGGSWDVFGLGELFNLIFGNGNYSNTTSVAHYYPAYDGISVETFLDNFNLYGSYQLVGYNKDTKRPFIIRLHGGITITGATENITLTSYLIKSEKLLDAQITGARYARFGAGIYTGVQVSWKLARKWTLVLGDFSNTLGIVQPVMPELVSKITMSSDRKELIAARHHVNQTTFSYAVGLKFTF